MVSRRRFLKVPPLALWENYAPEAAAPGEATRRDFVGPGGLPPIGELFERCPFGREVTIDLSCARRRSSDERPSIEARASAPVDLEVRWAGRSDVIRIGRN